MDTTPTELRLRAARLDRRGYTGNKAEFCDSENAALLRDFATLLEMIRESSWVSFETFDEAYKAGLVHGLTTAWLQSVGKRVRLVVEE